MIYPHPQAFEILILRAGKLTPAGQATALSPVRALARVGVVAKVSRGPGYGGHVYGAGSTIYVVREAKS